jgi:outer membrane protein OmpA-like peptidoglycan-associated protein
MMFRSRIVAASLASALVLAGCAGTGQRQQTGAVLGGMFGGLLGARADDDNRARNAAFGAAAGAIAGGAVGALLDRQAQDLRSSLENDGIIVQNTGEELIVTMPGGLLFDTGSAAVSPAVQRDLTALANNLVAYPDSIVSVIGHTDDTGSTEFNQRLSEQRANAVAGVLVDRGVSSARIVASGRGETQPVASNATEEGRRQNRRVEVIIRPTA